MNFSREVMPLKVTSTPYFIFEFHNFKKSKMADVKTSDVNAKLAPVNLRS
jgi:hypothetical protein